MTPFEIFLLVTACVLVLAFATCFLITILIFKKAFGRANKVPPNAEPIYQKYFEEMQKEVDWFENSKPEQVSITSHDGLKLCADLLMRENAKGTIILMHGYHGRAKYDFSLVLRFFYEYGFNVLLPDQRAHGKSEGKYLTFGDKESHDCYDWAKYIANRFKGLPIDLHGVSMGGATVTMATRFDLPSEVKCICSDCGFTSADQIIANVRRIMKLPAFPFQYFVRFLAKHFAKFDMCEVNTVDILSKNKLPLLLIHGGADDFVPTYMSHENYQASASENKRIVIVEGSGHAMAYVDDRQTVTNAMIEFLNSVIK